MPALSKLGDMSTGHDGFPPTPMIKTPVTKTFVNGILAGVADPACQFADHQRGTEIHPASIRYPIPDPNNKTYIEGFPIAKIGDSLKDGDAIAQGSGNSFSK